MPKGYGRPFNKGLRDNLAIAKGKKPPPKWAADPSEWVGKDAEKSIMDEYGEGDQEARRKGTRSRDLGRRGSGYNKTLGQTKKLKKAKRVNLDPRMPARS